MAVVELERLEGGEFTVQLSKEHFRQLDPRPGEQVYVELRNLRVFSDDYQI